MCKFTSAFLFRLMHARGLSDWQIAGGSPFSDDIRGEVESAGGYYDGKKWHNHFWLANSESGEILDLTASQFGAPEIITGQPSDNFLETASYYDVDTEFEFVWQRAETWLVEFKQCHPEIFGKIG